MPSSSTRIGRVLADIGRALRAHGSRWYLFGAQAAILHGVRRMTADVDVTVDLDGRSTTSLLAAFQRAGLEPSLTDPDFVAATRVVPLVHRKTDIPVDVVLAGPGIEDLFFSRASPIAVGSATIPVAAPEDLIVMKILAGRPKDLEDAQALIASRGDALDAESTRRTLSLLESLLDQSDLVPVLDRLLRDARPRRPRARPARRRPKR